MSAPLPGLEPPPRPPKPTIWDHDDGIIRGKIVNKTATCDVCNINVIGILIHEVKLPTIVLKMRKGKVTKSKDIKPHPSLIAYRHSSEDAPRHVGILGITCGCLTKFHRQIARIDQRTKDRHS